MATGFDLNGGTITSAETGKAANLVFERTEVISSVNGENRLASPLTTSCELRPFNWPQSGNTYGVDEEIQIAVFCTEALAITGTPQVPLIIGGRTRYANYVPALSVASQPVFSYTVQNTDVDSDGIQYGGPTPWRMNGGSVVLRGHKTPANLPASSYSTGWIVGSGGPSSDASANVDGGGSGTDPGGDGTNRPANPLVRTVTFDTSPQYERTYRLDEQIRVAVRFTVPVTVTGTPQIGLTIGSQTRQAAYAASRSAVAHQPLGLAPGSILVFTYTIQETDADADGISIAANALALNGGTINRASDTTIAASLEHDAVGTDATRKVNGRLRLPPDLSPLRDHNVPSRDGTFRLGEEMLFVVYSSVPVTVTGRPHLELLFGEGSRWGEPPSDTQVERMIRYAEYDAARSQPDRLIFSYTVQAGDYDDDGITARNAPIKLNGGVHRGARPPDESCGSEQPGWRRSSAFMWRLGTRWL